MRAEMCCRGACCCQAAGQDVNADACLQHRCCLCTCQQAAEHPVVATANAVVEPVSDEQRYEALVIIDPGEHLLLAVALDMLHGTFISVSVVPDAVVVKAFHALVTSLAMLRLLLD